MNRDLLLELRLQAMKEIDIPDANDPAIKELVRVLIPDSEQGGNKLFSPFMAKYTELIVKECADVVNSRDDSDTGFLANLIKKHFGVEDV